MSVEVIEGKRADGTPFICLKSSANAPVNYLDVPLLQDYVPDDAVCRICQHGHDDLIKPCWCAGSVQWICRSCLRQWRRYGRWKGIQCDLCGFAFLYECESLSESERLRLGLERSARPLIVLIGCLGFAVYKTLEGFGAEPWHIFLLIFFMIMAEGVRVAATENLVRGFPIWFLGCGMYVFLRAHPMSISSSSSWQLNFPVLVLLVIVHDALWDLHASLCEPSLGSFGYSFQRMQAGIKNNKLEAWELHKAEWARGGIFPIVNVPGRKSTWQGKLKWFLEIMALTIGFYLSSCMMLWESLAPALEKAIVTNACQKIVMGLLALGGVYLVAAVAVHWQSVLSVPPIRLCKDVDGKPRFRGLQEHEERLRPLSRQVSPASDNADANRASEAGDCIFTLQDDLGNGGNESVALGGDV